MDGYTEWLMVDYGSELEVIPPAPGWQRDAACLGFDPDLFFDGPQDEALAVCASCSVRDECYRFAVANGFMFGTFGGATAKQRAAARGAEAA